MARLGSAVALALLPALAAAQSPLPGPVEALGFEVGADHSLASYTQLVDWWTRLAAASDRIVLEEIGTTSYGQPMVMAVVSAPENLARREELRRLANRLCLARGVDEAEARRLANAGRAVVWVDGGLHATETIAGQNILELVWQLVSREDDEARRIRREVITLVCPVNPDGLEMVAKAYMATRSTSLPVLYQRYVGHDNNRDFYASNMAETAAINRVFYRRWTPQIVYNHHQTAPRGTVIFTPPFRDPANYFVDPLLTRGIEIVATHMNHRFAREGKPGVVSRQGANYSMWWNGGLRTTTYFHNIIGILTEVFGSPAPSRLTQPLDRRLPKGDYPMPVASQEWRARQTIDYLQTANFAILDYASRYRFELLHGIWRLGHNSIERGSRDHWTVTPKLVELAQRIEKSGGEPNEVFGWPELRDARAYVLPADQPDRGALLCLVDRLGKCGVEVLQATAGFTAGGLPYPQGSFVVRCDQAFRPHVLDTFEPQWHPNEIGANGQPVAPYDSAGWTQALQMGVQFDRVLEACEGPFAAVGEQPVLEGAFTKGSKGFLIDARDGHAYRAVHRLLAAGRTVYRLETRTEIAQRPWLAGTFFVPSSDGVELELAASSRQLGLRVHGIDALPEGAVLELRRPRIGLFDVWGGNMPTGWTQWLLQQFDCGAELVFSRRVTAGELRRDYDVLVFHTGLPSFSERPREAPGPRVSPEDLVKLKKALPAFEDWSRLDERLVALTRDGCADHLRAFVEQGGTLLALGDQSRAALRLFDLPVREGVFVAGEGGERRPANRSEFFIPGSLVRLELDPDDPLAWGMPRSVAAMFRSSLVFDVEHGSSKAPVTVAAHYARQDVLASGWAIGESLIAGRAAVVQALVGEGRVVLFGPDVVYRGQPWASFKLLFNAILAATGRRLAAIPS